MHPDHVEYQHFTYPAQLARSLNSLAGIIEGIAIDQEINELERGFLEGWIQQHVARRKYHPFNELIPVAEAALVDGVLTEEGAEDIRWLVSKMRSAERIGSTVADLQRLHAVLGGIVADCEISEAELRGLSDWMEEHVHLRGCWPYDEIDHLVAKVLADGKVDEEEQHQLTQFFTEFIALSDDRTVTAPTVGVQGALIGLCAVAPEIQFAEKGFCFTGASYKGSRSEMGLLVSDRGGTVHSNPSRKVDYLVIGAEGNPCWTYACYGRKVERAVELRKQGVRIMIVHERDFHDALVD
ncbi:BRCT domain-containing protein [Stenotrophomonas sp. RS-48]|uniref:BRCT domain-containing protein n=1 Tax=Stenotrophomonas sp. RS-48 TaxID=3043300 RepID=UPI0024B533AA|nr:BRCT domain-containing protein [Stenotrophomonas sp. RS-48]MDI9247775.1 BRCT domain-containing protein [Stenotrophomonas sp. RS-48]